MSSEKNKLKIFQPVIVVMPPNQLVSQVRMGMITETKADFKIKDTDGNSFYSSKSHHVIPLGLSTASESGYIIVTVDDTNKILYWGKNTGNFIDSPEYVETFKTMKTAYIAWYKAVEAIPEMKKFDPVAIPKNEVIRRYKKRRRNPELNKLKAMLELTGKGLLDSKVQRFNSYTYEEIMAVTTEIQLELDNL